MPTMSRNMPNTLVGVIDEWENRGLDAFRDADVKQWPGPIRTAYGRRKYLKDHIFQKWNGDESMSLREAARRIDKDERKKKTVSQYLSEIRAGDTKIPRRKRKRSANVDSTGHSTEAITRVRRALPPTMTHYFAPTEVTVQVPRGNVRPHEMARLRQNAQVMNRLVAAQPPGTVVTCERTAVRTVPPVLTAEDRRHMRLQHAIELNGRYPRDNFTGITEGMGVPRQREMTDAELEELGFE